MGSDLRIVVPTDLASGFLGLRTPLLAPFGGHASLLRATIQRLLDLEVADIVVVHRQTTANERIPALLEGLRVRIIDHAPPPDDPLGVCAALDDREHAELAIIVRPEAAFVSGSVLRAQVATLRASGKELCLCPQVPAGLAGIVIRREALTRLSAAFGRAASADLTLELFGFIERIRPAFDAVDAVVGPELSGLPIALVPRTFEDVAELAELALPVGSESYDNLLGTLAAREWARWGAPRARRVKDRLKILVAHYTNNRKAGATRSVEILLDAWHGGPHDIVVALPSEGDAYDFFAQRVPVRTIPVAFCGSISQEPSPDLLWSDQVIAAAALIEGEKPDVVLITNLIPSIAVAARLAGVPSLYWVQMPFLYTPPHVAATWGRRAALTVSDLLVAGGTNYAKQIQAAYRPPPGRLLVVQIGTPLERFKPELERGAARGRLGLPVDARIVLVAGVLNAIKRPELAIDALPQVIASIPDALLVFAGAEQAAGYQEKLERRARDAGVIERVRFLGFQDQIEWAFAATDVLLHCAAGEPFGMVLTEAMAMQRPVVAVDAGGPGEIVIDGETGRLIPAPGLPEQFAAAIIDVFSDPLRLAAMGLAGERRVHQTFAASKFARKMASLCEQLAAGDLPRTEPPYHDLDTSERSG